MMCRNEICHCIWQRNPSAKIIVKLPSLCCSKYQGFTVHKMPEVVGTVDNGISRACLGLNLRMLVRCIIVSRKKKFQNEIPCLLFQLKFCSVLRSNDMQHDFSFFSLFHYHRQSIKLFLHRPSQGEGSDSISVA